MTLFNGNPVDPEAFEKGAAACLDHYRTEEKPVNPYPAHSDQWRSWNKGWNSVEPEEDNSKVIWIPDNAGAIEKAEIPEEYAEAVNKWVNQVEEAFKDRGPDGPVKVITDLQMTEVSLMPDGSYAPVGYITYQTGGRAAGKTQKAMEWLNRLADSQEEGSDEPE